MKLTRHQSTIFVFLVLLTTIGQFSVDVYLPSMPAIAKAFQATVTYIKLTVPLFLIGVSLSQLIYGPLSDAKGRKFVIYLGLSIYFVGSLGCLSAANAWMLIGFRLIQGCGIGAAIVNVRAMTRDTYHGKLMAKISARTIMIWAITPMIAPVVGGYIQQHIGWKANFAVMVFYALLILSFVFFLLKETLPAAKRVPINIRAISCFYLKVMTCKLFLAFAVMSALCYGFFITFATASPFLLQDQLGLSPIQYGWSLLFIALGISIGSMLCNKIVHSVKIISIFKLGSSIMMLSTIAMVIISLNGVFTIYSLTIPVFLGSIGCGMIFPNCTTGAMTPFKSNAGIAGAAFGFIQMLISFAFTFTISHLSTSSPKPLSILLLIISCLLSLLFWTIVRPNFIEEE